MREAGTVTSITGSPVLESWCTHLSVCAPRSNVPGSVASTITMQLPLMRSSPELTATVT